MNRIQRATLLVVLACIVAAPPSPAWAYFESTTAGARGAALGTGSIASTTDASAFYWNPAGLAMLRRTEALADYSKPYEIPELNGNVLAIAAPAWGTGWSAGWQRLAIRNVYAEDLLTVAAGRTVWSGRSQSLAAGATFKYGRVSFEQFSDRFSGATFDFGSQAKGSLDAGLLWSTPWSMDLAWVTRDLLRPRYALLPGTPGDVLDTRTELGAAIRWNPESTLLIGWAQPEKGSATFNVGLEIVFYDVFAVRSGVVNVSNIYRSNASPREMEFSGGIGVFHRGVHVDATATTNHDLGVSYRASLRFAIGSGPRVTRALLVALFGIVLAATATPARALTKIEGEYQLMLQLRKDVRAFPWDYDTNDDAISNPLQLRMFSQPRTGVEAFVRIEALWRQSDNNRERPEFRFRDAHVGFRKDVNGRGQDLKFFTRQRRFWVDNYLIKFVEDREATGARLDTWGFWHTNVALIVADRSDQLDPSNLIGEYARRSFPSPSASYRPFPREFAPTDSLIQQGIQRTDDMYVVRIRREFLKERRLRVGYTGNRYEGWNGRDSTSDRQEWNAVHGIDARYRWGDTDIAFEVGQSRRGPGDIPEQELSIGRRSTGIRIPERAVLQGEIRSLRLGTPRLGYINVAPIWWNRAPLYQNSLGGPGGDETGFEFQTYYLLPERAITYTNHYRSYGKKNEAQRTTVREMYNELYIEFVNGFTAKSGYRSYERWQRVGSGRRVEIVRDKFLSWTNELQVENRLAKLRVQSKFQNIGRPERKQLFVIEPSINLTDRVKVYNRFALGNDPNQLRKGIFTQIQYRPTGNMEIYLQYGPDNIGGGSNPVEDGNLAGSGDQYDELKFILKGNF